MLRFPSSLLLSLALALASCVATADGDRADPADCEAWWGPSQPGASEIHVDAAALDGGDGSFQSPFSALGDAILAARDLPGPRRILIAAGSYRAEPSEVTRGRFRFGGDMDDTTLAGCGPSSTVLEAIDAPWDILGDAAAEQTQPVLEFRDGVAGVTVRDLRVIGGKAAIQIWFGAGEDAPIRLRNLLIERPIGVGLVVSGYASQVDAEGIAIVDPQPDELGMAWGISVQQAASSWLDRTGLNRLANSTIRGATGVGVLVDSGHLDLDDVSVLDMRQRGDTLGRGVQYQRSSEGTLRGLFIDGAWDAAIHLHKPRHVTILDSTLQGTGASAIPGSEERSGDGISISRGAEPGSPSEYVVELDGNLFQGNARAGLLVEDITLRIGDDNVFRENVFCDGTTFLSAGAAYIQGETRVFALGGGKEPPDVDIVPLGGGSDFDALDLNREPASVDGGG